MKLLLCLLSLACVLVAVPASAQTADTSKKLTWDQPNVADASAAIALTYRHYDDANPAGATLTGVTCSGTTTITCQAPFPAFTPANHTIKVSAANSAGESLPSAPLPFVFVVVPSVPVNLRIQ